MTKKGRPDAAPVAVVVHPDAEIAETLAERLRAAGFSVQTFGDAAETLEAIVKQPPAVLVATQRMPGIDGWRLCRLLRSGEYAALNQVPILLVSETYAQDEAAAIAADLGADAFLSWPADAMRLVETATALARGEAVRQPVYALVAEDEADLAELLRRALSAQGYDVKVAHSMHAAREAIGSGVFGIAVIDYHLPDGGGDALLDELGQRQPDCACIMITGDVAPGLAVDWMRRGASAYLRKPFPMAHLAELCARARRERALVHAERLLGERTRTLRESEARYRDMIDQAADLIILHDREGRVVDANLAVCRQTGYAKEELLSMRIGDLDLDAGARGDAETRETEPGRAPTVRVRHRRKDGSVYPAEVTLSRVRAGGGEWVLCVGRDIGVRLREEQERERQMHELRRWHEATLGREKRILDLKREVNELLAGVGQPPKYPSAVPS